MKELRFTKQFKKDLKRYLNQPKKLKALNDVLDMLKREIELPAHYKAHKLIGDYARMYGVSHRGRFSACLVR